MFASIFSTSRRSAFLLSRNFTASSIPLAPVPRIVVVGGGTAGCAVSSALKKASECEITIIEPADEHHNQPMWTLVGGGIKDARETRQLMADTLPEKVSWLKETAVAFKPEENAVITTKRHVPYDYLVVACGLSINFGDIKGLPEALKTPNVSSNYSPDLCTKTWECLQSLQKGDAVFTYPAGPVKCGGAGQKIAYLAEDFWRSKQRRDNINVSYNTALPRVFGNAHYATPLEAMCAARDIHLGFGLDLVEVIPQLQKAKFRRVGGEQKGEEVELHYDFLHVVPKQAAPSFLQKSPLADKTGFVEVDKETLQHVKYSNVYAIGDCSNLPTSKTAAAISGQLQVLVPNLLSTVQGNDAKAKYNGYTSCPITTNYGKVMMCEFDYDGNPMESFPFIDQRKESKLMWLVKTKLIPVAYWQFLVKGASPWRRIPQAISNIGKS